MGNGSIEASLPSTFYQFYCQLHLPQLSSLQVAPCSKSLSPARHLPANTPPPLACPLTCNLRNKTTNYNNSICNIILSKIYDSMQDENNRNINAPFNNIANSFTAISTVWRFEITTSNNHISRKTKTLLEHLSAYFKKKNKAGLKILCATFIQDFRLCRGKV